MSCDRSRERQAILESIWRHHRNIWRAHPESGTDAPDAPWIRRRGNKSRTRKARRDCNYLTSPARAPPRLLIFASHIAHFDPTWRRVGEEEGRRPHLGPDSGEVVLEDRDEWGSEGDDARLVALCPLPRAAGRPPLESRDGDALFAQPRIAKRGEHSVAELVADTGAGRPPSPDLPDFGVGVDLRAGRSRSGPGQPEGGIDGDQFIGSQVLTEGVKRVRLDDRDTGARGTTT
jgi:hypothetical protein